MLMVMNGILNGNMYTKILKILLLLNNLNTLSVLRSKYYIKIIIKEREDCINKTDHDLTNMNLLSIQ